MVSKGTSILKANEILRVMTETPGGMENDRHEETSGAVGQVKEGSYGVVHNF